MRSTVVGLALVATMASGCAAGPERRVEAAATASSAGSASADGPVSPTAPPATSTDAGEATPATDGDSSSPEHDLQPVPTVAYRTSSVPGEAYTIETSLPVVGGVDAEVAAAIERQLSAWVAEQVAAYEREDAEVRVHGAADDGFPPGFLEIRAGAGVPTPALLSVVFTVTAMHQGMAHPWTVVESFTFDLASGDRVTLTELFASGPDVHARISAAVVPALVAQLDPDGEGWAAAGVREGAAPDAALLRRFVVDAGGLTLHFDQYQVAPGAAGPQAATLPWSELLADLPPSPLLRDALAGVA